MSSLTEAIADCLQVHLEAIEQLGTDRPESDRMIPAELRERIVRQREKVEASLDGDPDRHRAHVQALTRGLRIVLCKLGKLKVKPTKQPLRVWDAAGRR